jgi:16S rRNA (uracil1498-N3)-methyltransferase
MSEALQSFLLETHRRAARRRAGGGPGGGIGASEVEALKAIGAKCVTLGRRILRTETAGFCALTLVMGALGEM